MTTIERTAYPRFKTDLTNQELIDIYTPTAVELEFVQTTARGSAQRLALMVLLKGFQRLGYLPDLVDVPVQIVRHIHTYLQLPSAVALPQLAETSLYRYHQAIRTCLGVTSYRKEGEVIATEAIRQAAQTMGNPADLINVAIEELVRQRFELPAFSRLDRLAGHIRTQVDNDFFKVVLSRLTEQDRTRLNQLYARAGSAQQSQFDRLPGKATVSQMRATEKRLHWLESLIDPGPFLTGIPPARIKLFAAQAQAMPVNDFRTLLPPRRYTLLLCLIHSAQVQTRDNLVEMFLKRMSYIHKRGKEKLAEIREYQRETSERLITVYITTVFGYGCNLGPGQTSRHLQGPVTSRSLSFINRQHITLEKLDAAIRDLINRYNRFELPRFWGTGKTVAADGTQFDLYQNNLLAERHIRYGGYGGIAYYHVSDQYIALFSHFIACGVWEAVYIIDGLLKNTSDIQPDTIHADTQGQSTPVFGLAHLLGIKLMPRIRNWQDLILFRPSHETIYEHIDDLFGQSINWALIHTHWQDLIQVVLSIQAGKVLPSMLLRKLGNYSRKNRLYRAFRELGQVVRTVFLLRYISDQALRREITATTNKVESFNAFCKWLFFGGEAKIASNDPVEQEKRIKYNHLIANAVILQNVVDMTMGLRQLAQEEYPITREALATLSPYLTTHIRRFGSYVLNVDQIPDPVEFELPLQSV